MTLVNPGFSKPAVPMGEVEGDIQQDAASDTKIPCLPNY
jgi:hypothetical protein